MDITNLKENNHQLIFHMESVGYRKDYVYKFKSEIKNILCLAESGKVSCYADVYRYHEKAGCSKNILKQKRTIIGAIEQFDVFGRHPDGTYKQNYLQKGSYHHLCNEFKSVIDCFVEAETKRGIKQSSICVQSNGAATFLLTLQRAGVERLEDITEKHILEAFITPDGRMLRNYSCKQTIASVFKACVPTHPACEKVLSFLPALRKKRKNIQYLAAEEIVKVKKVLSDESSGLTLRDKAIGTLALYMGLRRCDIAGLTLEAVDFEDDLLHIRQQKTEVPITLPLTAVVGNAIYDYIKMERPDTDCDYVFVSQNRPFGRIQSGAVKIIAGKIMNTAGIRQNNGDRKGSHIFRYHFATKLLGNGVPRPVISNLVGHTLPASLDAYLSADFPHLKECAISIEQFPVPAEVFSI